VGFEPTAPEGAAVFKTASLDRSGTPPSVVEASARSLEGGGTWGKHGFPHGEDRLV
jgi:hypothetical protein